jgi:hypothetical protein
MRTLFSILVVVCGRTPREKTARVQEVIVVHGIRVVHGGTARRSNPGGDYGLQRVVVQAASSWRIDRSLPSRNLDVVLVTTPAETT